MISDLNMSRSVKSGMYIGREFQREGAVMVKALVSPGTVLGPEWWGREVCVGGAEVKGGIVAVKQVCEVGRDLVIEDFVGEEEDFVLNALWNRKPVEILEDGVMWSQMRLWVKRRTAEFYMY